MLESESHSSDETSYSTHGLGLSAPKSYETLSTLSKLRRKYTICKYFLDVMSWHVVLRQQNSQITVSYPQLTGKRS